MKKTISVFLFFMITWLAVAGCPSAKAETSGGTWDNITWELRDDGELIVSGQGDMPANKRAPWDKERNKIKKVTITEGVTGICDRAFDSSWNLRSVTLPESIRSIGAYAFSSCSNLTSIRIPAGVQFIGEEALSSFNNIRYYFEYRQEAEEYLNNDFQYLIYVSPGSYAEQYVKAKGLPYDNGIERNAGRVGIFKRALRDAMSVINSSMNETQKAKALHDWLIRHAYYYYDSEADHQIELLIDGYGVCSEYTITYSVLLTLAGIANAEVDGGEMGHVWNLARLEGTWYHIDCTWDDPKSARKPISGNENSQFFKLTDAQISSNHVWNHEALSADSGHVPFYYELKEKPPVSWNYQMISDYIGRCYRTGLGREPDAAGLANWVNRIVAGEMTPAQAAEMILASDEMNARNLNNRDFVRVLYIVFLNREPDEAGLISWVNQLEGGNAIPRAVLVSSFAGSAESLSVLQSMMLD